MTVAIMIRFLKLLSSLIAPIDRDGGRDIGAYHTQLDQREFHFSQRNALRRDY